MARTLDYVNIQDCVVVNLMIQMLCCRRCLGFESAVRTVGISDVAPSSYLTGSTHKPSGV
jgi:hypothetical protein